MCCAHGVPDCHSFVFMNLFFGGGQLPQGICDSFDVKLLGPCHNCKDLRAQLVSQCDLLATAALQGLSRLGLSVFVDRRKL